MPVAVKDIQFLGFVSHCRRFIKHFASIAKPLTDPEECVMWVVGKYVSAFEKLKGKLSSNPVLAYPHFSVHFILDVDASNVGLGAVLNPKIERKEHVIAYCSRILVKAERYYCTMKKELQALVSVCEHFFIGKQFIIRSDHDRISMNPMVKC